MTTFCVFYWGGADVVLPGVLPSTPPRQPSLTRPWKGDEFDAAEDTPRMQEYISAEFHENRLISVAVHW